MNKALYNIFIFLYLSLGAHMYISLGDVSSSIIVELYICFCSFLVYIPQRFSKLTVPIIIF